MAAPRNAEIDHVATRVAGKPVDPLKPRQNPGVVKPAYEIDLVGKARCPPRRHPPDLSAVDVGRDRVRVRTVRLRSKRHQHRAQWYAFDVVGEIGVTGHGERLVTGDWAGYVNDAVLAAWRRWWRVGNLCVQILNDLPKRHDARLAE